MGKRFLNRLTAKQVEALGKPGYYADGGNLYLRISESITKSWAFFFSRHGKSREMGLGPYPDISLLEAREAALEARKSIRAGNDPIAQRQADKDAKRLAETKRITFEQAAAQYIESHRAGWRNEKHASQWTNTLKTYAHPIFGGLPVAEVDTALVLKAIEPIWRTKTETASRVRGRIESVLDWATTRGYRTGDNPARWSGHLENLLPARAKVSKVDHHAAIPFSEIGVFMADLQRMDGTAASALEFTILTACRTGEVIGAKWSEIDFNEGVWTIPAERMKMKKEHRVPLSSRTNEILKQQEKNAQSEYVFPGSKPGAPLSNMAMLALLKRMKRDDLTVHGFRSAFRDWAGERSTFTREVIEHALAHQLKDKAEAAYARGTLFEKRKKLMQAWASYCQTFALENIGGRDVVILLNQSRA